MPLRRSVVALAVIGLVVTLVVVVTEANDSKARAGSSRFVGVTRLARAATGHLAAGHAVKARTFKTAPVPTAKQRRFLRDNDLEAGPRGHVAKPTSTGPIGPSAKPPGAAPQAPTDFALFRNKRLPAGGTRSAVDEPSTAQSGTNVFATGNWYAAYSHNKSKTWTYLDPFTIFGSGFCCDQLTVYDVSHNREFWLAQYNNHLMLANSNANNLSSWCYYNFVPSQFGLPSGASFDYNKLALSTNFVYMATNVYGASGGSLVVRFPIDAMTTCSSIGFNYYYRTTEFSPTFVQNAGDVMYWGTNWTSDLTLGSTFRIFRWDDTAGSASVADRSITPYTFMFNGNGNCASQDGVVLNWCQRTDSRTTGTGYVALPAKGSTDAVVGFAFNAQQDASHPFPYIRRVYFRANDLSYIGASELWAGWGALLYPTMAPDARGNVGMAFAWGGGTGTTHYYPGSGVLLDDDVTPSQPWTYDYYQFGAGNPCLNSDGLRRWGDYLDIHPFYPSEVGFVASGFALNSNAGSCGSTADASVANVVFGRTRDRAAYTRWK